MRVALVVDNPLRDLPGLVLLGLHLTRAGVEAILVPMHLQQWELFALAPDHVVLNYARPHNENLIHALLAARMRVSVLDTEGGVLPSMDAYERTLISDRALRDRIDAYLAWGEELARAAISRRWYRADQVAVTGSPRFDLYAPPWRAGAADLGAGTSIPRGTMILVNGNFPIANPRFQSAKAEVAELVSRLRLAREEALQLQRVQAAGLEALVEVTRAMARRYGAWSFVYRPHPFEREDTYAGMFASTPNVSVRLDGVVTPWVLRADALVQRSCSTAVEAALAGTPALAPEWIVPAARMEAADAVSDFCASGEELALKLEAAAAGSYAPSPRLSAALADLIPRWFFAVDGHSAARAAERIARDGAGTGPDLTKARRMLYGLPTTPRTRLAAAIRRRLGLAPDLALARLRHASQSGSRVTGKRFDRDDVSAVVAVLARPWREYTGSARLPEVTIAEPRIHSPYRPVAVALSA